MLPENTGFPVGGNTKFQYLVLQVKRFCNWKLSFICFKVHYINIERLTGPGDTAGVDLTYTEVEPEKSAGMLSIHVRTNVPALSKVITIQKCFTLYIFPLELPRWRLQNWGEQNTSSIFISGSYSCPGTGNFS